MLLIPSLEYGGSERSVANISKLLAQDYRVYLTVFHANEIAYEYAGTLIDLQCPSKTSKVGRAVTSLIRLWKLWRAARKHHVDVIFSFTGVGNRYNVALPYRCKKMISNRGFADLLADEKRYAKRLRVCEKLVFNSQDSLNYFAERYPQLAGKLAAVHNAFDLPAMRNLVNQPADELFLRFREERHLVVSVGRLCDVKAYDELIRSFQLVRQQREDVGLVIIGDGPGWDSLNALAKNSPFSQDILMLGARSNPLAFMEKCDLFVLSSHNEGFPNVVVEAMASGLPVVCTNCRSGPNELLNSAYIPDLEVKGPHLCDYGILVPVFPQKASKDYPEPEHHAMAQAIIMLLDDDALRASMAERSVARAKQFSFENSRQKYKALIDYVISIPDKGVRCDGE